jgi:hypothetical protein
MENNCYLRPAWTHNGSIRTDLPLTVWPKGKKSEIVSTVPTGQLCCVGELYLKTHDGLIRIR